MIIQTSKIKVSNGEKCFNIINVLFLAFLILVMVYPIWHVICASLSSSKLVLSYTGIYYKPLGFTTVAYKMMAKNPMIIKGYANTLFIVIVGVCVNILCTSAAAYFLSRKGVLFRNFIMMAILFTMYFSGGMIPFYFTVKDLGLENSLWSLIIPGAVNTYNLIIMRTSFLGIPDSLEESAKLDGAGHLDILFKIVLPLSKAVLAVMVLYYGVAHWNSWFNAMLFLTDRQKYPLQLVLREILIQNDMASMTQGVNVSDQLSVGETIKYAVTVVATIPILCVYPFLQKYFVKGVMIGAVKG